MEHHKRFEYCKTRLKYRQGRELKAVKVYSVANESRHLLVFGVPKVNLREEVKRQFQRYGELQTVVAVTDDLTSQIQLEQFTDVFYVQYSKLDRARFAKRKLDATQFYGGVLHISYAPEYESTEDLRQKMQERRRETSHRLAQNRRQPEFRK